MTKQRKLVLREYQKHRRAVALALSDLRVSIDVLGDMAVNICRDDQCDMLACFAANTLHGSEALLREMDAHVRRKT